MATTKTLTPTNQAITLAAFTEKPDNRTNVTNDDKMADAINTLNSNFIYKRGDTILIERNYLMGVVLSNARIALFMPVSKPFASALPSSTITSADITTFDISYEGNARALKNNITQVSGWMRQNGIDMLVTFSELPSGLSVSSVVGIDFRGSITI